MQERKTVTHSSQIWLLLSYLIIKKKNQNLKVIRVGIKVEIQNKINKKYTLLQISQYNNYISK